MNKKVSIIFVFLLILSSFVFGLTDEFFVSDIVSGWYLNDSDHTNGDVTTLQFTDDFTGTDGDPIDSLKWDSYIFGGGSPFIEIRNNAVRTYVAPPVGTTRWTVIQSKSAYSLQDIVLFNFSQWKDNSNNSVLLQDTNLVSPQDAITGNYLGVRTDGDNNYRLVNTNSSGNEFTLLNISADTTIQHDFYLEVNIPEQTYKISMDGLIVGFGELVYFPSGSYYITLDSKFTNVAGSLYSYFDDVTLKTEYQDLNIFDFWGSNNGTLSDKTFNTGKNLGATLQTHSGSMEKFGSYYNFDGVDDGLQLFPFLDNDNYSIMFYLSENVTQDSKDLINWRDNGNKLLIRTRTDGDLTLFYNRTDGTFGSTVLDYNNVLNNFSHISIVKNGSFIYTRKNGVLINTISNAGNVNTGYFTFGVAQGLSGNYFNGSIDEILFFNKALSQSEVESQINANAVNITEGLLDYYDLNNNYSNDKVYNNKYLVIGAYQNTLSSTKPSFKYDKAIEFDGVNDQIITSNNIILGENNTISLWLKRNELTSSGKRIIYKRDGTSGFLMQTSGDKITAYYGDGTSLKSMPMSTSMSTEWTNLIMRTNGTVINYFVNGASIFSDTYLGYDDFNSPLYIGGLSTNMFNGSIADVRIYNRSLTEDEILTLYNGLNRINIITNATGSNTQFQNFTIESIYGNSVTTSNSASLDVPYGNIEVNISSTSFYDKTVTLDIVEGTDTYYIQVQDATPTFLLSDYANGLTFKLEGENTYEYTEVISGDITVNVTGNNYYASILNGTTTLVNYTVTVPTGTNNIDLTSFDLNEVYFKDATNSSAITNQNITITYPNSNVIYRTTDTNGRIQFPTYNSEAIQNGTYSFSINLGGYQTPLTLNLTKTIGELPFNQTYNVSRTTITINLYDRVTSTLLSVPASIIMQGVGNFSTSNGTLIIDDITIASGTYTIQAIVYGYETEQKSLVYDNQEAVTLDFYLLNQTGVGVSTLTVKVLDEFQRLIQDATVNLLEYDPLNLSYFEVSECLTNSIGECKFLVELNTKTYKITATYSADGIDYSAVSSTSGEIFKIDSFNGEPVLIQTLERTLTLTPTTGVTLNPIYYLNYNITETFINNISYIETNFATTDGHTTKICLQYYTTTGNTKVALPSNLYCVEASSGQVTPSTGFLLNRSKSYLAEVYLEEDNNKVVLGTYRYVSDQSFQELLRNYAILSPMMLFFWILIIGFGLFSKNIPLTGALIIFLAVVETFIFPNFMIASAMVLKILLGFQLIYFGRKKEDFS